MRSSSIGQKRRQIWVQLLAATLSMMLATGPALAQRCSSTNNYPANHSQNLTPPANLAVSSRTPVGTVLWTSPVFNIPGFTYAECGPFGRSLDDYGLWGTTEQFTNGYWAANIAGLGFQVLKNGAAISSRSVVKTIGPGRISSAATSWQIRIVKTSATVGAGDLRIPGVMGSFDAGRPVSYAVVSVRSSIRITPIVPTCSVTGASVVIGDFRPSDFPAVGSVSRQSAASNVQLSCTNAPNVTMVMVTGAVSGTNNVIPLTGGAGSAQGLGVQVMYNNTPLVSNAAHLVAANAGTITRVPIAGRYYRTGDMRPGTANAVATLRFTYQ
jgi:type 1 fimbria pilin